MEYCTGYPRKIMKKEKGNNANKKHFFFGENLVTLGRASRSTSPAHNRTGKGKCHKRSWNQRSHWE